MASLFPTKRKLIFAECNIFYLDILYSVHKYVLHFQPPPPPTPKPNQRTPPLTPETAIYGPSAAAITNLQFQQFPTKLV